MPRLPPEDAVEPRLRRGDRRGLDARRLATHLAHRHGVRALVAADVAEQLVGRLVTGGAEVEILDLLGLRGLSGCQQPVDRGDTSLQPQPRRQAHRGRVGHGHTELPHPLLEPPTVPSFRLRHAAQELCALRIALTLRDQLVDRTRLDLAPPRLEQPRCRFTPVRAGHCSIVCDTSQGLPRHDRTVAPWPNTPRPTSPRPRRRTRRRRGPTGSPVRLETQDQAAAESRSPTRVSRPRQDSNLAIHGSRMPGSYEPVAACSVFGATEPRFRSSCRRARR